jgi:hypothetical protein
MLHVLKKTLLSFDPRGFGSCWSQRSDYQYCAPKHALEVKQMLSIVFYSRGDRSSCLYAMWCWTSPLNNTHSVAMLIRRGWSSAWLVSDHTLIFFIRPPTYRAYGFTLLVQVVSLIYGPLHVWLSGLSELTWHAETRSMLVLDAPWSVNWRTYSSAVN